MNVDPRQTALDPFEDRGLRFLFEDFPRLIFERIAVFRDQFLRDFDQIFTLVAFCGQVGGQTERLPVARLQAQPEHLHLAARVIEVIFHLDSVTERRQDIRHRAADHAAARASHRDRAGGVGAHTFDLRALAAPDILREDVFPGGDDRLDLLLDPAFRQADIQKTGRRGFDRADKIHRGGMSGDDLGDLDRLTPGEFGQLHGDRAGIIGQFGLGAALHRDRLRQIKRGQIARRLRGLDRVTDQCFKLSR